MQFWLRNHCPLYRDCRDITLHVPNGLLVAAGMGPLSMGWGGQSRLFGQSHRSTFIRLQFLQVRSLAYVYGRETKADADIANGLTLDEARRIASNIAKLPKLLGKGS